MKSDTETEIRHLQSLIENLKNKSKQYKNTIDQYAKDIIYFENKIRQLRKNIYPIGCIEHVILKTMCDSSPIRHLVIEDIDIEKPLSSLCFDYLDSMELLINLECHFDIDFPESVLDSDKPIKDVIADIVNLTI